MKGGKTIKVPKWHLALNRNWKRQHHSWRESPSNQTHKRFGAYHSRSGEKIANVLLEWNFGHTDGAVCLHYTHGAFLSELRSNSFENLDDIYKSNVTLIRVLRMQGLNECMYFDMVVDRRNPLDGSISAVISLKSVLSIWKERWHFNRTEN
jgi:hypothetical protein